MTSDTVPLLGYIHSRQGSHKYPAPKFHPTVGYVWRNQRAAAPLINVLPCYSPSIHLSLCARYQEARGACVLCQHPPEVASSPMFTISYNGTQKTLTP